MERRTAIGDGFHRRGDMSLSRILFYTTLFCVYGIVCLILLALSMGFGFRIGGRIYADEGLILRTLAGAVLLALIIAGFYFARAKLIR